MMVSKMFKVLLVFCVLVSSISAQEICYLSKTHRQNNEFPACNGTLLPFDAITCKDYCLNDNNCNSALVIDGGSVITTGYHCYVYPCSTVIQTPCTGCDLFWKTCRGCSTYTQLSEYDHPMCESYDLDLELEECKEICNLLKNCTGYKYRQTSGPLKKEYQCFIFECTEMFVGNGCTSCDWYTKHCKETLCVYLSHGKNTYGNCGGYIQSTQVESEEELLYYVHNCLGVSLITTALYTRCILHACDTSSIVYDVTYSFYSRSCSESNITTVSPEENTQGSLTGNLYDQPTTGFYRNFPLSAKTARFSDNPSGIALKRTGLITSNLWLTTDDKSSVIDYVNESTSQINPPGASQIEGTCNCTCRNVTIDEYMLQCALAIYSLRINKSNTSSSYRLLTSAGDDRSTSKGAGAVAVAIIAILACIVTISDLVSCKCRKRTQSVNTSENMSSL